MAWVTSPYRKSAYPSRKWPNIAARMPRRRPYECTAPNSSGSTAMSRPASWPIQLSSISGRSNSGTRMANLKNRQETIGSIQTNARSCRSLAENPSIRSDFIQELDTDSTGIPESEAYDITNSMFKKIKLRKNTSIIN